MENIPTEKQPAIIMETEESLKRSIDQLAPAIIKTQNKEKEIEQ